MMNRLPPRWHMFVREAWFAIIAYLAIVGLFALFEGRAEPPPWWLPVNAIIWSGLGCLVRRVPSDIKTAREARADL
jgi:hypothetical protein